MPRNAHHRLDHTGTDRHQSRAFHLARLLGAIRDSARLLDSMRHIGPRNYEIDSAFYLGTICGTNTEDDAGSGCPRRGCRRMPAGQGCDHQPQTDGSASGPFNEETEE